MSMFEFTGLGRRGYVRAGGALVAAVVLGLFAGEARAEDAQCLLGTWEGTLTGPLGQEIVLTPVTVVLNALSKYPKDLNGDVEQKEDPNKSRQQIIFAPPYRCRLSLAFAGQHTDPDPRKGTHFHLTMIDPNGGKCEQLQNIQLRLACLPDKNKLLAWYSYSKADKTQTSEQFELTRASSR